MKVICIKEGNYPSNIFMPRLVVGEYYTVIKETEQIDETISVRSLFYELSEFGSNYWYGRWNFSTISEIDETEFERNYQKEKV